MHANSPSVDLKAGPIVCEPGQPGYRGAKAPTNNAAELEAIEQMIVAAAAMATETDFVEVHSDSRLAIMAALGIPRKTKKKRRQPRGQRAGGTNGVNDALATRARESFARAREKLHGRIVLRKVKGHAGDTWNEVADALAAIGRATAVGATPVTAELMDRIQRALDGMREYPDITCHGFAMT